jgi:hypothetical protein
MGGGGAVLAVADVVDNQHAPLVRGGGWFFTQQLHPLGVDLLVVPGRLRHEPLQPLDLAVLGAGDRLGTGQPGQGLVPIPWQQQALQIVTEATALGQAREQSVEPLGVGLERPGAGGQGRRLVIGGGGLLTADPGNGPRKSTATSTNY